MNAHFHFKNLNEDIFYIELKEAVEDYFKKSNLSPKANATMTVKCMLLVVIVVSMYFFILLGSLSMPLQILALIILGTAMVGVGFNISHEALHNAFSHHKKINHLLGYTLDILGPSSYLWKINHNAHHSFTNIHGSDGDIKDSKILRLCPHSTHQYMHRFQLFSVVLIYSFFYLIFVYILNTANMFGIGIGGVKKVKHTLREVAKFIFFKLLYIIIWVLIPIAVLDLTAVQFFSGYLILSIVIGSIFTTVFALAHTVEEAGFPVQKLNEKSSWAIHQIVTTCNFTIQNKLLTHFLGGLNFQIEHHLFPNICSIHYPKISPIVKQIAEKHHLVYHSSDGMLTAIKSHFKLLQALSKPNN